LKVTRRLYLQNTQGSRTRATLSRDCHPSVAGMMDHCFLLVYFVVLSLRTRRTFGGYISTSYTIRLVVCTDESHSAPSTGTMRRGDGLSRRQFRSISFLCLSESKRQQYIDIIRGSEDTIGTAWIHYEHEPSSPRYVTQVAGPGVALSSSAPLQ
jgi:hypothetical protein